MGVWSWGVTLGCLWNTLRQAIAVPPTHPSALLPPAARDTGLGMHGFCSTTCTGSTRSGRTRSTDRIRTDVGATGRSPDAGEALEPWEGKIPHGKNNRYHGAVTQFARTKVHVRLEHG